MFRYSMGIESRVEAHAIAYKDYFSKLPFYPTGFGKFSCDNHYFTERSNLPECLILYTISGNGFLNYQNQEKIIPENCAAVIDCMHYQYYANTQPENWDFWWIHFSGKCAADYVEMINENGLQIINLSDQLDFKKYFAQLVQLESITDSYGTLYLSDILSRILSKLVLLSHHDSAENDYVQHKQAIERAISYIQQNYLQMITIDDLARISQLSKFYFIKVFRQFTGDTPYHFLNLTRITQAKRLLIETNLSVSEISAAVGFSDVKNFIFLFKKEADTTPLQFRKSAILKLD